MRAENACSMDVYNKDIASRKHCPLKHPLQPFQLAHPKTHQSGISVKAMIPPFAVHISSQCFKERISTTNVALLLVSSCLLSLCQCWAQEEFALSDERSTCLVLTYRHSGVRPEASKTCFAYHNSVQLTTQTAQFLHLWLLHVANWYTD